MDKKVLIIGDSFVEGVGATNKKGWAYQLESFFPKYKFTISGEGGDNAIKVLKRFPSEFFDCYILQVGTNDSRYRPSKKNTELSEKEFAKTLSQITLKIYKTNPKAKIYMVGLLFVDENKTAPYKEDKVYLNQWHDNCFFLHIGKIQHLLLFSMCKNKKKPHFFYN